MSKSKEEKCRNAKSVLIDASELDESKIDSNDALAISKEFLFNNIDSDSPIIPIESLTEEELDLEMEKWKEKYGLKYEEHIKKKEELNPMMKLLNHTTPSDIARELKKHVIGQDEMIVAVADFAYYHAMRQFSYILPPRPILISGPSGTGKTEVFRALKKAFPVFRITFIDAASLSLDGWTGSNKLSGYLSTSEMDDRILVFDEFDKMCKPKYGARGGNVSADLQAEFLKLLEGELIKQKQDDFGRNVQYGCGSMGFALIGSFEDIYMDRKKNKHKIGFDQIELNIQDDISVTEEELIKFGIIPEIVGRIATRAATRQMTDEEYLRIVKNENSRVGQLVKSLSTEFNADYKMDVSDEYVLELILLSKNNRTGVRWVLSQIEERILSSIRDCGVKKEPWGSFVGPVPIKQPQKEALNFFQTFQDIEPVEDDNVNDFSQDELDGLFEEEIENDNDNEDENGDEKGENK